jgi:glycogen debranching enzyme
MYDQALIEEGREHARRRLLANGGDLGLLGSSQAYQQVWARDRMICGLGLLLCGAEGIDVHRRSLATLARYQSPLGKIPHNVGFTDVYDPALLAHGSRIEVAGKAGLAVEDTIHAGCVDGNLWFIVGHYYYHAVTGDLETLRLAWPSLERALLWLRYQDSNECGLLEIHEAMDWADLFANRYNVLFDNVLYVAAWRCMAAMSAALGQDAEPYRAAAADTHRKVNALLWVGPEEPNDLAWIAGERKEWLYVRRRVETELVERPFYLPYMAFRDYADRFDTLGNLLAILFGVADGTKAGKILDYIEGCGLNQPYPVRALYPPIHEGERDWRDYYRVRNLNLPHHYHNGGAWPFIGGFYVAALVRAGRHAEARAQLGRLAEMNRLGRREEWEFNEWFHGTAGRPMGYAHQSWSTALYLFACDAVEHGRVRVFDHAAGWME